MALLVGLLVAVAVVVLVMRAAASPGGVGGASRRQRAPRPPRTERPRALAPDDDPEFLRELQRRARRDDPTA
jgi:hypothetical protein